jgi:cholestenol Delta-isomerase
MGRGVADRVDSGKGRRPSDVNQRLFAALSSLSARSAAWAWAMFSPSLFEREQTSMAMSEVSGVGTESTAGDRAQPLSISDRVTLGMVGFFVVMAFTIELYFILHYNDVHTQNHFFAKAYGVYSAGDQAYFGKGDIYVPLALETLNVFFTQGLNFLLMWAIVKRRAWRHPLQLLVSSYLTYSVVFYFWVNHVSGYVNMPEKTPWAYFIFYAPNLPWLLGHAWMAWQSFAVMTRRLAQR